MCVGKARLAIILDTREFSNHLSGEGMTEGEGKRSKAGDLSVEATLKLCEWYIESYAEYYDKKDPLAPDGSGTRKQAFWKKWSLQLTAMGFQRTTEQVKKKLNGEVKAARLWLERERLDALRRSHSKGATKLPKLTPARQLLCDFFLSLDQGMAPGTSGTPENYHASEVTAEIVRTSVLNVEMLKREGSVGEEESREEEELEAHSVDHAECTERNMDFEIFEKEQRSGIWNAAEEDTSTDTGSQVVHREREEELNCMRKDVLAEELKAAKLMVEREEIRVQKEKVLLRIAHLEENKLKREMRSSNRERRSYQGTSGLPRDHTTCIPRNHSSSHPGNITSSLLRDHSTSHVEDASRDYLTRDYHSREYPSSLPQSSFNKESQNETVSNPRDCSSSGNPRDHSASGTQDDVCFQSRESISSQPRDSTSSRSQHHLTDNVIHSSDEPRFKSFKKEAFS